MHRCARTSGVVVLVVGMMLTALPVCAQARRPARPYRSLFGNVDANRPSLHSMDLTVSLNGAADDGLASPASADGAPPSRFQGLYSAVARLNYVLRGRRLAGDAAGSVNLPYYAGSGDQLSALGYGANASLSYTSGATTASTSGSYTYSPYYSMALDPAAGPGASAQPFDSASARNPNHTNSAGATLTRRLGRRTSASLVYAFNESSLESPASVSFAARMPASRPTVRCLDGSPCASRMRTAKLDSRTMRLRLPTDRTTRTLGLDTRASRRAARRRQSTSASARRSSVATAPALHAGWRGSARVSRTFAPGWTAGAGFTRSLQFNTALQTPIWADIANVGRLWSVGPKGESLAGRYLLERPAREPA